MSHRRKFEEEKGIKLTSKDILHHINFNHKDNKIENLWKCDTESHRKAHKNGNRIIRRLLKRAIKNKLVSFDRNIGKYYINDKFDIVYKSF